MVSEKLRRFQDGLLVALFALALLIGSTVSAAAQGKRFNKPNQDRPRGAPAKQMAGALGGAVQMRVWARALKLSDQQIRQIRQIYRRNSQDVVDLDDQIRTKRQEMERAIFGDNYNEDNIKQLAQDLGKLEGQRIIMVVKIQSQIRQVFTSEQLKTFNELRFGNLNENEENRPENAPADQKN